MVHTGRAPQVVLLSTLLVGSLALPGWAQGPAVPPPRAGLLCNSPEALAGYTMLAPLDSDVVRLVDMEGRLVHEWRTSYVPGSEYFLADGTLLRSSKEPEVPRFSGGGQGGRLQRIAWDGTVLWDWTFFDDSHLQHHDIAPTPQGTILFIAWDYKTAEESVAAGRDPAYVPEGGLWPDSVVEVRPIPPDGAEVIWEWHVFDHLVQDWDEDLPEFDEVAYRPERLDVNAGLDREPMSKDELERLKALGYMDEDAKAEEQQSDWMHTNAIAYDPELDLIALSVPNLCEVFVVDHSTTTAEAASSTGGRFGHGGDLLFRWGNPRNYGRGGVEEQRLYHQHHVNFVRGPGGEPRLTIFNNGAGRPDGNYSAVVELELPLEGASFVLEEDAPFGPAEPVWEYTAPDKAGFFSSFISGAQRLRNGNTLICEGDKGRLFEVTRDHRIVWEFWHDFPPTGREGQPAPAFALFRATRIPADHPALAGKDLQPIDIH